MNVSMCSVSRDGMNAMPHLSALYSGLLKVLDLAPPTLFPCTEIHLSPWTEHDLVILSRVDVGKSEGERSGTADDGTVGVVLRSVARTHKFIVRFRPRDDTSKVTTNCIQGKRI